MASIFQLFIYCPFSEQAETTKRVRIAGKVSRGSGAEQACRMSLNFISCQSVKFHHCCHQVVDGLAKTSNSAGEHGQEITSEVSLFILMAEARMK